MRPRTLLIAVSLALLSGSLVAAPAPAVSARPVSGQPPASHEAPAREHALLATIAAAPSADALRATIERLVGFGTRNTLSDTQSETRGIGAARRWVKSRFAEISQDCGGCLQLSTPAQSVTGKRVPQPTEVMDILAIQRGTEEPNRVIIISGHLDSRVTDVMDIEHDAPGANDDASGVAALIEAARILSQHRFRATLVFAALSGEEQGLYGGKVLADFAKAQGWQVEADLNNDIVGNTRGQDGVIDTTSVRVFAEGTKSNETLEQAKYRRYHGGEVDSPSRNIARFMADLGERYLTNFHVRMVYRTDRYGRGGDQVSFLEAGYPAVRVTEGHENYTRQHQDLRTENGIVYGDTIDGVDFAYLAHVTALNAVTMAALASAPMPPTGIETSGAVESDTAVKWQAAGGAAGYRVWWRDTLAPQWQFSRYVSGLDTKLANIVIDDWFFGVSAVSADGYESPVAFPGEAGSF